MSSRPAESHEIENVRLMMVGVPINEFDRSRITGILATPGLTYQRLWPIRNVLELHAAAAERLRNTGNAITRTLDADRTRPEVRDWSGRVAP